MKKLIVLILVMSLSMAVIPAQAGKPKPTPYPQPVPELGTEAYPAPGEGLSGIQVFEPPADDPDPQPGIPYVWGIFFDNDGSRRVFVTVDLGYPDFELTGIACIMSMATYAVTCYDLSPHHYAYGRMSYHSAAIKQCGTFAVQYATLGGLAADIRQPNSYPIKCVFIPWVRRFWY